MPPTRVVSLIASSTEMVCALGCQSRLVGRSHECDYPPSVRGLPAVTRPRFSTEGLSGDIDRRVNELVEKATSVYEVDAGALAKLEPDLIITQVQCRVCAVSLDDVEQAVAQTIPSRPQILSLEAATVADIERDLRRVAEALGVLSHGLQLLTRLRGRMRSVAERAKTFTERPRVATIEWIDPLMAAGHWTPELITMAGAENVFGAPGEAAPKIAWADLAGADPDVLWVAPCGFDIERSRAELAGLAARPEWTGLRAVREGRVYVADGNQLFNRPGPRVVEALETLAEALHPNAFRFGHEGSGWVKLG